MTTIREARRAPKREVIPAAAVALLTAGKLEQTCPDCGRWEAAGEHCSWCGRRTGPADWYRNGDVEQRRSRRPALPPSEPPMEFRSAAAWPEHWGTCPYVRATPPTTPHNAAPDVSGGTSRQMALSL